MPRSIRIDPQLEQRLIDVARNDGVSVSAAAREAIKEYCDKKQPTNLHEALKDFIGAVSSDYLCADRTSEAFTELLVEKHKNRKR